MRGAILNESNGFKTKKGRKIISEYTSNINLKNSELKMYVPKSNIKKIH